ncbi:MAG TPA: hypothetical protein PLS55_13495 [Thermogutta sp.]|nr:hypothetical protein [Thermogutta sp.]
MRCLPGSVIILATVLAGAGGCANRENVVEWRGVVQYQGQPVESGMIRFEPLDPGLQSAGASISRGRYSVKLKPGKYQVSVRAFQKTGEQPAYAGSTEMVPVLSPIAEYRETVEVRQNAERNFDISAKGTQPHS